LFNVGLLVGLDAFIMALKRPVFTGKEEKKSVAQTKPEVEDLVIDVKCTLRELYAGCMKNIVYKREKLPH